MAIKSPWNCAKIFHPFDALPWLWKLLLQKERKQDRQYDEHGKERHPDHDISLPSAF